MSFFRRRLQAPSPAPGQPTVPGLEGWAAGKGWQPAAAHPFGPEIEDDIHRTVLAMYHAVDSSVGRGWRTSPTHFSDAFRGVVAGRGVVVANAWTEVKNDADPGSGGLRGHAACAVELSAVLPVRVEPRHYPMNRHLPEMRTGDPTFDEAFRVLGLPSTVTQVLTPDVRRRLLAHADWLFTSEGSLLLCLGEGAFASVPDVERRVQEVLDLVAAIPGDVMPARVDHSVDDLAARIAGVNTMDDALAFLQALSPEDRERLARSDTPLAAFADVRTAEEAVLRLQQLDPGRQAQMLALFMRVDGAS